MTERVLGPTGSPRRRWSLLLPLVAVIGLALFYIAGAQATHDLKFQLDGDTSTTCGTVPSCATQTLDWDSMFNANTSPKSPPANFANATFSRDFGLKDPGRTDCSFTSTDSTKAFCTADSTTFATGSKDTLNISGWQCNQDNNVNSKIDIMNAYAVAYTDPATGDRLLYFGLEKNKDNGTNNVGFWFLQGNASCSSSGSAVTWSGLHADGDVLVVSEFTSGGGVSNITAYKWQGTANPANPLVPFGSGGDCKTTTPPDVLCATTNSGANAFNGNIQTSWLTADATLGVGNTVVPPDFFEGAINLTDAFAGSGTPAPSCFNTFVADTRSSKETTATLFDFARGTLGQCNVTMTTAPSLGSGGSTTLAGTGAVTDTATIAGTSGSGGTAPSPTGTVNFFLCAPGDLTPANTGTCEGTSGTAVTGNPVTVTPGTAPNSTATSGNVRSLLTVAGRYCFRAVFTAAATDTNYAGQTANTSNPTGECFTVTGTASSSSTQRWLPNDRVTLTGDSNLNGTLTVTLYSGTFTGTGGNCAPAATATAVSGQAYTFTVSNGLKTGVSFNTTNTDPATSPNTTFYVGTKPDGSAGGAAGTYFWLVDYDDNALTDPPDRCETSTVTITD